MTGFRLVAFLLVGMTASTAFAAGGGGSAGGAGAQNQPASGLPFGEAGPLGSPNNPRKTARAVPSTTATSPASDAKPDAK